MDEPAKALEDHPWLLCYAESDDGIHWRKPKLGICDFKGSKANNIVLTTEMVASIARPLLGFITSKTSVSSNVFNRNSSTRVSTVLLGVKSGYRLCS